MRFFIRFLTKCLEAFNSLPDDMQIFAARTVAIGSALSALGVGSFVKLVAQWVLLKKLFNRFPKTPPVVPGAPVAPGPFQKGGRGAPVSVPTVPATGPAVKRSWASRLGALALALAPVVVLVTFDYGKAKKEYSEAREVGKGHGLAAFEGFVEGLKGVPLVGAFFEWYDKQFDKILGKKGRFEDRGEGIGDSIVVGIFQAFGNLPAIGPFMAPILNGMLKWWGIRSPSTKAENRIGKPIVAGIMAGLKNAPIIGPVVRLMERIFGAAKGKREGQKWQGIGKDAVGAILKGFVGGGLVGGAVALIGAWFSRSKEKREGQKWRSLGSSAAGAVAEGFKNGGLIGAAAALIGSWFARAKQKREGQKWGPLGSSASAAIAEGWRNGGLVGAAVSLVASWFSRAKKEREGQRWKPLGSSASAAIADGWRNGGLLGAVASLIASWFRRAKEERDGQNWKPLGSSASAAIAKGWKNGGLLGAAASLIASWFGKAKQERDSQGWYGIGKDAALGIARGFTVVRLGELFIKKMSGAVGVLRNWIEARSPSRKLDREVGYPAGLGIAAGFERAGPAIERAARAAGQRAHRAAGDELRKGMVRAEDGSWVPKSFYSGGNAKRRNRPGYVQAEDGSWVPKSFYGGGMRPEFREAMGPDSPGGRAVTAAEMREITREGNRELINGFAKALRDNMRGGMSLDDALGGYIEFRNGAGVNPR